MKLSTVGDIGEHVGKIWQSRQTKGPLCVAVPLSSTPLPIFDWVINNAQSFDNWESTNFVLMDEQVEGSTDPFDYVPPDDSASYERFARANFLDPLHEAIDVRLPVLKPNLIQIDRFDSHIDVLILAIGPSGNYANVMPGTKPDVGWHVAELTEEFRTAHTSAGSQSYEGARFRTHGMSLGPQQVLNADKVIVIATGAKKRPLVDRLLSKSAFDPDFPISIVHHSEVSRRVEVVTSDGAH